MKQNKKIRKIKNIKNLKNNKLIANTVILSKYKLMVHILTMIKKLLTNRNKNNRKSLRKIRVKNIRNLFQMSGILINFSKNKLNIHLIKKVIVMNRTIIFQIQIQMETLEIYLIKILMFNLINTWCIRNIDKTEKEIKINKYKG